ncbi:MAG: branched-chain amino acid ABC transporter permease [Symbiobacterium thermophilum]|uniref:Branched-chain amino acid ABC transporter permease protein n=2 Tax=Symbiobacterium thermophilum TaxID=2734 RepID=Q67RA6_SYMTH|nr:branched-chain amino acid ABC transporter permease [Symbiobacterium thermophilum]OTA42258.1 MAG: branched-chain amino acid ABC transporter permease [Symbiobacterium thermophilum]BAD39787.1 branched-chain amino acid ABC transporter permease protein [Symbiobacterium thermophilum IAM 14863]
MIFAQQIISGLATGSLYALAALGLVLIFKTTDVVNFAQGEMAMFGTFIMFTLLKTAGLPYWGAFVLALAFAFLMGAVIERVALRPLAQAPLISVLIATLGLMQIINGVAGWIWGYQARPFPTAVSGSPIRLGDLVITLPDLVNLAVSLVVMTGFFLLFKFTKLGIAMRAVAENRVAARLMGIPTDRILSLTWGLGGVLAATAGILIAPVTNLDINMMADMQIKAFTAAVLGGFTSLPGAVVGGLTLGVLENLVGQFVPQLKTPFAFGLIVLVLMLRPSGLMGTVQRKKV